MDNMRSKIRSLETGTCKPRLFWKVIDAPGFLMDPSLKSGGTGRFIVGEHF